MRIISNDVRESTSPDEALRAIEEALEPRATLAMPLAVEKFLEGFKKQQEASAKECITLAEWFEDNAVWLRNRAATMVHMATQIPSDVGAATLYERESNERVKFLSALRNPTN